MANIENLVYDKGFDSRTTEEVSKIATKGGIASGIARREKATCKKMLEMFMGEVAKIKDNEDKLTYGQLSTIGLLKGAIDGKAENYKLMLELLGELKPESSSETPVVNINIVDNSSLEEIMYEDNT